MCTIDYKKGHWNGLQWSTPINWASGKEQTRIHCISNPPFTYRLSIFNCQLSNSLVPRRTGIVSQASIGDGGRRWWFKSNRIDQRDQIGLNSGLNLQTVYNILMW